MATVYVPISVMGAGPDPTSSFLGFGPATVVTHDQRPPPPTFTAMEIEAKISNKAEETGAKEDPKVGTKDAGPLTAKQQRRKAVSVPDSPPAFAMQYTCNT